MLKENKPTRTRYLILAMLFIVTMINYADRATLSIASPSLQKDIGLDAVSLGYVFSAFGWAYVIAQIPSGWLLDRFGSKKVYGIGIFTWSLLTLLQGHIGEFNTGTIVLSLFLLRFLVGLAEAPSYPGNARIVASWFPTQERGFATSVFNAGSYFATVVFAPIMGYIVHSMGWEHVFIIMGGLGIIISIVWAFTVYEPRKHPLINAAELDYIESNGGLVDIDKHAATQPKGQILNHIRQLFANRMMRGIYLAQFCNNSIVYFFLTWFPVYLVQERHMDILKAGIVASLPAICGCIGALAGGAVSDGLLRRGHSLSVARKGPIICGLLLATTMVFCNYVESDWLIVTFMALAFFGQGFGGQAWAVVSDTAPKEIVGVAGGLFNMIGNLSSITTPIVIGYIIAATGSFKYALIYIGANALLAVCSHLFIVGPIKRIELKPAPAQEAETVASSA
ncbi:MFS transporter [Pantoea sp. Tr-811]|uniref:MFS transporter n=1 Tax=Pantoea sp. Tr-811 TaxID=2608361 RepID=UPI001420FDA1|nr:MFS transporter [Pantoea sp. Tr-811]NIF30195.1 MFS transporter [Pantoea sp. Tr-811]